MRSPTYCGRFCNAPVDQTAKSDLTPAGCDKTRCGSGEALLGPSAGPTRGREELNSHSVEAECRETIVAAIKPCCGRAESPSKHLTCAARGRTIGWSQRCQGPKSAAIIITIIIMPSLLVLSGGPRCGRPFAFCRCFTKPLPDVGW